MAQTTTQNTLAFYLDAEKAGREAKSELLSSKLIHDNNVVFVSEALASDPAQEADIEDLLDGNVYEALVKEAYKAELRGKKFTCNQNVPRVVKRMEEAFKGLGLTFQKTRVARLFMTHMGNNPDSVFPAETRTRFEKLFELLSQRLEKHRKAGRTMFR